MVQRQSRVNSREVIESDRSILGEGKVGWITPHIGFNAILLRR